ncbi:MAG: alanine dehydrogenase [Parachlamydiaceae bacterium]
MKIGVPKEIKSQEYRVGATPGMVKALVEAGHSVSVQSKAGLAVGFKDEEYAQAGAEIALSAEEAYQAEMILKVKEPQESEFGLLKEKQILFCYLHLAPNPYLAQQLIKKKVIAIAYETVTDLHGHLPLLVPMSEIAGRIAIQVGANYLQLNQGGKGLLLGGGPGVFGARVVIIGGGVVGTEAARMALGLGARVVILDRNLSRLRQLEASFGPGLRTLYSNTQSIDEMIANADLLIGSVLLPGKKAPMLIKESMIRKMEPGSVFVDVAIDQGGCSETSKPTSHDHPTYQLDGVIHYCVTNMPGTVAKTATLALTNATTEYALLLANQGWRRALLDHKGLRDGLNIALGKITNPFVANDLNDEYVVPESVL